MTAWHTAADTSTFTIVANKVSQWDDKSGNGHHLTQTTAGDRPLYDGTPRTINDIICPEFTAGEFMVSTCPADDRTATYFFVGLADSVSHKSPIGDTQSQGFELRFEAGGIQVVKSAITVLAQFDEAPVVGTPFILCVRMDAANIEIIPVGMQQTTAEATTFTAGRTLQIGKDQSGTITYDGLFAELLVYSTKLTDADMNTNFVYLCNSWLVAP